MANMKFKEYSTGKLYFSDEASLQTIFKIEDASGRTVEIKLGEAISISIFPDQLKSNLDNQIAFLIACQSAGILSKVTINVLSAKHPEAVAKHILFITGSYVEFIQYLKMFYLPKADSILESLFHSLNWSLINPEYSESNVAQKGYGISSLKTFDDFIRKIRNGDYFLRQSGLMNGTQNEKKTKVGYVTDCALWKCPKCGELLEKSALGIVWFPFEEITKVKGTGTCSKCGAKFPQSDIYSGSYDVKTSTASIRSGEMPESLSIVLFRLRSNQPPPDDKSYCRKVLAKKFPKVDMKSNYIIGFANDLSTWKAFALYQELVRKGQLPDLGSQVDSFEGLGPDGANIVALFFNEQLRKTGKEISDEKPKLPVKIRLVPYILVAVLWTIFSMWICIREGEYLWIILLVFIGIIPLLWEYFFNKAK